METTRYKPTIAERLQWARESLGRYPENESERLGNIGSALGDLLVAMEEMRGALVALLPADPWAPNPLSDSGDRECFFCGQDSPRHFDDCPWVAARALLSPE